MAKQHECPKCHGSGAILEHIDEQMFREVRCLCRKELGTVGKDLDEALKYKRDEKHKAAMARLAEQLLPEDFGKIDGALLDCIAERDRKAEAHDKLFARLRRTADMLLDAAYYAMHFDPHSSQAAGWKAQAEKALALVKDKP